MGNLREAIGSMFGSKTEILSNISEAMKSLFGDGRSLR